MNVNNNYSKQKKTWIILIRIMLIFSLFLVGCDIRGVNPPNIFELDKIDLFNKKYALIFSEYVQSQEQMSKGRNVLLLIDDAGNYDAYQTYGLTRANVNWTVDGLYFSDIYYEYFIDNEGHISKTEKITDSNEGTAQDGSSVDDDGRVWSWFDIGFTEEGYETRITRQDKETSIEKVIEGVYTHLFTVENQLFGVSSSFGLSNGINKEDHLGLVKFEGEDLIPQPFSWHLLPNPELGIGPSAKEVVLRDNIIYVIGEAEELDFRIQTNLMMWNIDNGDFETKRIAIPTDHFSGELNYYSYYTHQNALQGDELFWFNERAELNKTNLVTFETEVMAFYDVDVNNNLFYSVEFVEDSMYMLVDDSTSWGSNSVRKDGVEMRLLKTNLSNPNDYTEIEIKNGKELYRLLSGREIIPYLERNSFAVNPLQDY